MRFLVVGLLVSPLAWATSADLAAVYQAAQAANPTIQASQASLNAARQDLIGADAALNPSVKLSATGAAGELVVRDTDSAEGGYSSLSGTLSASLPLIAPTEQAAVALKRASLSQAQVNSDSTAAQLILDVADAYFDSLSAKAQLGAAQAQRSAVARQLERAQQRLEVGLGTRVDVDRTQASYDLAAVAEIRATDTLAQSFDRLEQLTGERYDTLADLSERYQTRGSQPGLDAVLDKVLSQSAAMRAAQAGVDAARAGLATARAAQDYRVDAGASADSSKSLQGGRWNADYRVSVTLSMPLYTGGRNQASEAAAIAKLTAAQADLEATRRDLVRATRSLYRSIATQAQTVDARMQAIRSAETAVEATEGAYEVGSGDVIDVLNAQSDLFSAQSDFQIARYDHARLGLQLEQLQGDLTVDDLSTLNRSLTP